MSIEVELRLPTVPYAYAQVTVKGDTEVEVFAQLSTIGRVVAKAIDLAGGGDSAGQAERLIKEQLGGEVIERTAPAEPAPWDVQPSADPFGPPVPSPGPAPFGADPFASTPAPAAQDEYYTLEIPQNLRDDWSPKLPDGSYSKEQGLMNSIQKSQPKGTVKWLADKKRWGIKRTAPQNIVDGLRQRGYGLS